MSMIHSLQTDPPTIDIGSGEDYPVVIDLSAYLLPGETITGTPTATLTRLDTNYSFTVDGLHGALTIVGNIVTQYIWHLLPGRNFRLTVTFVTNNGADFQTVTIIRCPV